MGPELVVGTTLLLEAVAMSVALFEDLEDKLVGVPRPARIIDRFGEAEGAPVALGDGLDISHDLVGLQIHNNARVDGLVDAFLA